MPGLPLPSLPAKEFLEGAKSAPRWALFVPSVGMLALQHPLLGSRGGGCPRGWLVWLRGCPRGLVLLRGSTRDAQLVPRSTGCWGVRGGGQAGILLVSLASAVTLSQLLLLVPLRAFNWSLFLIGGRSFGENWKFGSGSF